MKNRVKTHLIQAKRHSDQGNRKQALDSIKKALVIDPGEIVITEVLIAMERAENTGYQDEDNYPKDITIGGLSNERNQTADMDSKLEKIFRLSDEALASGNDSKALAYLKKAVQLFPDEQIADQKMQQLKNRIRAENLVKIGKKKLSEGDIEKAITASRKAFDLLPAIEGLKELLNSIETVNAKITGKRQNSKIDSISEKEISVKQEEPEAPEKEDQDGEALLWADRIRTAVKDDNFEEAGKMVAEAVRRHPNDTLLDSFHSKLKRLGFVVVT
ncbi:MAG: hypothetical protein KAH31_11605 [Candidatus Sabulitectum sp.]|nr:hypothetical protein [Candidatus Sabulitectum sp.]